MKHKEFFLRASGDRSKRPLVLLTLWAAAWQAHAAGGHHAVDDAAILEPGQCQVETWRDQETGGARSLFHVGPACRIGAFEAGLNLDRTRAAGAETATVAGPQVKWAQPLGERFSAGAVVSTAWQDRSPARVGTTLVVPLTWRPGETVLVHLNAGRDFRRHDVDSNRAGAALEWTPLPAWSFVAERFRESRTDYWRAGARWALTPSLNVDLSRARGLGDSAPAWWTLGTTWAFQR